MPTPQATDGAPRFSLHRSGKPSHSHVRLPAYGRRVWIRWILITLFGAVPAGALLGFLFGDPANGEFDTALAWGSTRELLKQLGAGVWICTIPWTAIYF